MRTILFAVTMFLAARAEAAECIYHNGYYEPDLSGACSAETLVPAGCPVHVATPSGNAPRFAVYRGMQEVTLQSSASLVDTLSVPMDRIDPFDCDCARVSIDTRFDRYAVTVNGAVDGDSIVFEAGQLEGSTSVAFGPPGPCLAPTWPTMFFVATQCDRCPGPSDSGSGSGSGSDPGSVVGCSATDGAGVLALGSVLSMLVVLRRRRAIASV